jgi:mRNA interferase RelE/StbE
MTWKIKFTISAEKEFAKLTKPLQQRIILFLDKLIEEDPRLQGVALKGNSSLVKLWRYRIGQNRIICQIKNTELIILVVRIANRDSVYKNLNTKEIKLE